MESKFVPDLFMDLESKYSVYNPYIDPRRNQWFKNAELHELDSINNLKKGDIILMQIGYYSNILAKIKVAGFDKYGAYFYWDCYWYPVDLNTRYWRKLETHIISLKSYFHGKSNRKENKRIIKFNF